MKCFQFILLPRDSKLSHSRRFGVIVRVMDRTLPSVVRILSCTRTERTIQLQDSEMMKLRLHSRCTEYKM